MAKTKDFTVLDNTLFILRKTWGTDKMLYLNAAGYALLHSLLAAINLYIPKWILDVLLGNNSIGALKWLFAVFAAGAVAAFICQFLNDRAYSRTIELRFRLVEDHQIACLTADYETMETVAFEDQVYSSYRCVSNNTSGIEGILHKLYYWPGHILSLIISAFILVRTNVWLIIPALLSVMAGFLAGNYAAERKASDKAEFNSDRRKTRYLHNIMKDRTTALDVRLPLIRALLLERYSGLRKEIKRLNDRSVRFTENAEFVINVVDLAKTVIVYVILILRTFVGKITVASFSLCIGAMEDFTNCMMTILKDVRFMQDQNPGISDFRDFTQKSVQDAEDGQPITRIDEIRFENVSYKYQNADDYAVKNVSCTIRPGHKIAIVGENGAGKTTFVKLLLGLYTPASGRILVNGTDLKQISKRAYHECLATVFQDFHILAFSIYENVALQEEKEGLDKAEQALRQVGMLDHIRQLPQESDTPASRTIYPEGTELSGGEAQRMALARAIYRDADLYVLDEPSAALDPIAESNLYKMFAQSMQGKTIVFVTHRLASTAQCDEIFYFDKGEITEHGTHKELMASKGGYAVLYEKQAVFYRDSSDKEEAES